MRKAVLVPAHRVVVKVGSSLLAPEGRRIRRGRIGSLASQVASLRAAGRQVIIVSSGAIASGMQVLALRHRPAAVEQKQALAAVGQPELMRAWGEALRRHGLRAAQVLLTADDLQARSRCLNARRALAALLERGLVPVVNENDVVAVEEIRMGDNDSLSALVALFCGADALVLLTDVDGLFRGDPRRDGGASLVPVVERVTAEVKKWAGVRAGSLVGSGGMPTKLRAAEMVTGAGHAVLIANGGADRVLVRAFRGERIGTLFLPGGTRMSASKRWLAYGMRPRGALVVDAGARTAVVERGTSLLPRGVVRVEGEFEAGDPVSVADERGGEFARGLCEYSSAEMARIRGLASRDIAGTLGFSRGDEAIHRDRLVLTAGKP